MSPIVWRTASILLLAGCTISAAIPSAAAPAVLPKVFVLATGGTIAGAQAQPTGYAYKSAAYDVATLLAAVPRLGELADISGEQVASVGSQDMSDALWLKLAGRVDDVLARADTDAVLITHGTDTLEETSYFLSLVIRSDKPVVMVGAMRPATAISADGPGNLYDGVAVATHPEAKGKGTLVVLADTIHFARNVVKTDTTGVQAFSSINRGPAGVVHSGKVEWFEPMDRKFGRATEFSIAGRTSLPRVDVIYAHAGMSADLIDAAVARGAKGIVVAGVGDGNVNAAALDALTNAVQRGVAVVRSTRLPSGLVRRNNEVDDDAKGFVASGELNPAKSRVLLQLALTQTSDPSRIQRMFNEY
jgi:L-asparaginase